jgi:hypothetical protein
MRKIPLIFGLILLAILTVWETYNFFVTDDGIGYFTSQPRRLLYIAGIGVVGGVLTLTLSRLSPGARRTLRLAVLGSFGVCVTALLTTFAIRLASFASMVTDVAAWGWVITALISLSVLAVLTWLEFYLVWRRPDDAV